MAQTQAITLATQAEAIEATVIQGDLSQLRPAERTAYYKSVCESLGLNPLTQPFEYLQLNGKLRLYARRDCTDQLRKIHAVSIRIVGREKHEDCYVVTAQASLPNGRTDESIGVVPTLNLKGENLANALMKAETKAKRRVTLAICGLAVLDESELEGVGVTAEPAPRKPGSGAAGPGHNISPHLEPDENPGDFNPNAEGDAIHRSVLERFKKLKEDIMSCGDIDDALLIRTVLGSHSKQSQILRELQTAREQRLISPDQRQELGAFWMELDRMLKNKEADLDPGSAADYLADRDASDPGSVGAVK